MAQPSSPEIGTFSVHRHSTRTQKPITNQLTVAQPQPRPSHQPRTSSIGAARGQQQQERRNTQSRSEQRSCEAPTMLPGVELARRRRVHYHGDVASPSSSSGAGDYYAHAHHAAPAAGVAGPALAARIRLEEKLRGAALPSMSSATSPSRWSRLMRDGRSTPPRRLPHTTRQDEQQDILPATGNEPSPSPRRPAPLPDPAALLQQAAAAADMPASTRRQRRAELTRTLSKVDVCAVCLEEVRAEERVTRLPCSHKYHTECVLPWLAAHPDCPCCRALVPSADTLVQI